MIIMSFDINQCLGRKIIDEFANGCLGSFPSNLLRALNDIGDSPQWSSQILAISNLITAQLFTRLES